MWDSVRKGYRLLKGQPSSIYIKKELSGVKTVLNVGCGVNAPTDTSDRSVHSVGIDLFKPSLLRNKNLRGHNDYVLGDINHLCFQPKSFEAVVALDVIEHLGKIDGYRLIENMEEIASKTIMVFTPNGFVDQSERCGNPHQKHLSSWTALELKNLGFHVNGINGIKFLRKNRARFRFRPIRLFTELSVISQKITYHFPDIAFQLLGVKKLL
jgi:predicted TPR repeat methyltransferase